MRKGWSGNEKEVTEYLPIELTFFLNFQLPSLSNVCRD